MEEKESWRKNGEEVEERNIEIRGGMEEKKMEKLKEKEKGELKQECRRS